MPTHFDHLTIVVRDVDAATRFFGLLGFRVEKSVVISGEPFASYMDLPEIEAEHVTLVLEGAGPRSEVQLLKYRHPEPLPDSHVGVLNKLGFNHVCFAVADLNATIARLTASGVRLRNQVMDFHNRRLVFVDGPEGVTIELAEWH